MSLTGVEPIAKADTVIPVCLDRDIALVVRLSSTLLNQANAPIEFNVGHFRDAILQIRDLEMSR